MDEVRIGDHTLQPSRQLLMNGERVHLGPRALDILTVLAKADGEIVTKDELFEAVWPGQVIEENALQAHVTAIRKALGEDAGLLETIRGIGYQLHTSVGDDAVAPDALIEPAPAPLAPVSIPPDTPDAPVLGLQAVSSSKGAHRRKLLASAVAAILALGGGAFVATIGLPGQNEAIAREPVTVAIMPFTVVGDFEEGDEQLGAGLAGALNTSLSQLTGLALTSNSSPSQLAQGGMAMPDIAEQLGVDYFIEGEIQYMGKDVVVSLSLLEGKTTRQIWRDQVRDQREYLPVASEQATYEIATVLQSRLGVGTGEIAVSSGVDPEAYEAYLLGMQHFFFPTLDARDRAFAEFQRSVRLDPDFAPAHAGLGAIIMLGVVGQTAEPAGEALMRRSIEQALKLDPQNLMARTTQELIHSSREGKFEAAFEGFEAILKDHPDYTLARWAYAHELSRIGEYEAAIVHSRKVAKADPLRIDYYSGYAMDLLALGKYEDIRAEANKCIECAIAIQIWGIALVWIADDAEFSSDYDLLLDRYIGMGAPEETAKTSKERMTALREGKPPPMAAAEMARGIPNAMILVGFGEFEAALDMLDQIPFKPIASGNFMLLLDTPRKEWPEAVRADPRYHALFDGSEGIQFGIKERRKRGHTQNLPVFPVKPYEGP